MSEPVLVEEEGRVVFLTINRPEARNAMTFAMYERLHEVCERVDRDPRVRVLVVSGAGDKAALRDAEDLILSCYLSQDFQEGVRAFLDKRKPEWQGR